MKLGICIHSYPGTLEEQVELMKQHGFETTFCMARNVNLPKIVALCQAAGIVIDSLHAPYKWINNMWEDSEDGELCLSELMKSVDECRQYGIPLLVVHLSSGLHPPRINTLGTERFERLTAYAEEKGVILAYENQRRLANLAMVFEEFPYASFCWDTGHEACFANGRRYMPLFGHKLSYLHLHDNHGEFDQDEHRIPGDGSIDFDYVTSRIAETDYQGSIMLELAGGRHADYQEMGASAFYARAAKAARHLRDEIERKRKIK